MYEDGGKFVVQTRFVATYSFTCWSISTRYNKSPLVALLCLYTIFHKTLDMGWISCMQYECPINSPRLDRWYGCGACAKSQFGLYYCSYNFSFFMLQSLSSTLFELHGNSTWILIQQWKIYYTLNTSASGHYFVISKIFKPIYKYEWKSTRYPASYVWSGNSGAHE